MKFVYETLGVGDFIRQYQEFYREKKEEILEKRKMKLDRDKAVELIHPTNKFKVSTSYLQNPFCILKRKPSKVQTCIKSQIHFNPPANNSKAQIQLEESEDDPIPINFASKSNNKPSTRLITSQYTNKIKPTHHKSFMIKEANNSIAHVVRNKHIGRRSPDYTDRIEEFDTNVIRSSNSIVYTRTIKTKHDCLRRIYNKLYHQLHHNH